ncbi:PepSY domain-containing protein [Chitinophaga silvatica]|uniref:PepSY domain-containing protein n=1 Tax=Chitinophaga silvatica TaxID=2282649 RepID=A0A3E1YB71_9BACT|nr:PepSY-associated TM helix domain-containing protein [Chitinophaga silvatica]RFS23327.1 PepSY domain-containing protein [Chitinophaga silvatica]
MKVFFRRIHLYLGLAAGLIITISCLTGAMLVFEKEITEALNHDRYFVKPAGERLTLDQLAEQVKQQVPGAKVGRIQLFADPTRSVQITLEEGKKGGEKGEKKEGAERGERKEGRENGEIKEGRENGERKEKAASEGGMQKKGAQEAPPKKEKGGRTAFVNPYTGKVIELYSYQKTFYYKIFSMHRWLMAGDVGKVITGISTLIFLFILITGIILWWPKTRNILRQRLKVKWDGGWKRLNHDMHIVLGFYASIFLFVSAFTGLTWAFEWFNNGLYTVLGSSPKPTPAPVSAPLATADNTGTITLEQALATAKQQVPDAIFFTLMPPKDTAASFSVALLPPNAFHEAATTSYYLDQHTGKVLSSQTFEQRTLGQKVRGSIKPLHTGSIFGLPSKIFAFILALLGVTFPTTGTILWINRTRKKSKKNPAKRQVAVN